MPRETLDREIRHVQEEILLLGSMVEQAILNSAEALRKHDFKAARRVTHDDHAVNEKRFAIENAALILLATQQPMAHDLRFLAAVLEVITELERIGDYAKGIARVTLRLGEDHFDAPWDEIQRMADLSVGMLNRGLAAFIEEDVAVAHAIPKEDSQVDELYVQVYRALMASMIADPTRIDQANLMLWVAHNLERTADRVTNICERTVFLATGEMFEMESSDDEEDLLE